MNGQRLDGIPDVSQILSRVHFVSLCAWDATLIRDDVSVSQTKLKQ